MLTKILFLFSFLFSISAYAWEIKADFESGSIGNTASGTVTPIAKADAFHSAADDSKYVASPVLSGNQAGSVTIKKGENGFGKWGGAFNFPSTLKQGDSVWFRVNVYYPNGWSFDCGGCTLGMKFMRVHAGEGYQTILINGGTSGGKISVTSEINANEFEKNNAGPDWRNDQRRNLGFDAPREQWITYEMQIKFHSVAGQGIYRVWQNGSLIFEDLKTATLATPTSTSKFVYLYTYWNNGAPKTQTSYVDDITITNVTPATKDNKGNPFIGTGSLVYKAPPKSPTGLSSTIGASK